MTTINKETQKQLALELSSLKNEIANIQSSGSYAGRQQSKLHYLKAEFRLKHIAYSMSLGTPYEKIEPKTRFGNEPDMSAVNEYLASIRDEMQEKAA